MIIYKNRIDRVAFVSDTFVWPSLPVKVSVICSGERFARKETILYRHNPFHSVLIE